MRRERIGGRVLENLGLFAEAVTAEAICALLLCIPLLSAGCSLRHKVESIEESGLAVHLSIPDTGGDTASAGLKEEEESILSGAAPEGGKELVGYRDGTTGEINAYDTLDEIKVEAVSANVAERGGEVEISFEVSVPEQLVDSRWQLRLRPQLILPQSGSLEADTLLLDYVNITGKRYRERQIAGYDRYRNYLSSIVPEDTSASGAFFYGKQFAAFMSRHATGNTLSAERESAMDHYARRWLFVRNERLKERRGEMFAKFVKDPLQISGVRRDTVVAEAENRVRYRYTERLKAPRGRKKMELAVTGTICMEGRELCKISPSGKVEYYISSLIAFAKRERRYKLEIVERNIMDTGSVNILYAPSASLIDTSLGSNAKVMRELVARTVAIDSGGLLLLDSVTIISGCSPDGPYRLNKRIADERAAELAEYIGKRLPNALIRKRGIAEDWERFYSIVCREAGLPKEKILATAQIADPDARERALSALGCYGEIKERIYPKLRRSLFRWHIHRKGMVKDTLHTHIPDTLYDRGIEALFAMDYERAAEILPAYGGMNGAIALLCTERNVQALVLLMGLPKSAERDYMAAVALSRLGRGEEALEMYRNAVEQERSMIFRGNLDPEIQLLTNKTIKL